MGEDRASYQTPGLRAVRRIDADASSALLRREPLSADAGASVGALLHRIFDVVTATTLLVLAFPLIFVVIVGIVVESPGPFLYRSRRVGRDGLEFDMLKFRKMRHGATGPPLTAVDDDRFTRVGRILTRMKLDELPQLWNVVRGDMSLVGPRPESPIFVQSYPDLFHNVLECRPGITGLSQLAFVNEDQILARPELAGRYVDRLLPAKLAIDLLYIGGRSIGGDLRILVWTCAALFLRVDVAVDRATGSLSIRAARRPAPMDRPRRAER